MSQSPSQLIAELSRLKAKHPAYASVLFVAQNAIKGMISLDGVHGIILTALASGANTYADLQRETGFSASYLHRHLHQLIKDGQVYTRLEARRGQFRARKLFFLTEKEPAKTKK